MDDSTVYVVRVWRGCKPFRATARIVDGECAVAFSTPADLLQYMLRADERSQPSQPPDSRAPGDSERSRNSKGQP
jgi:hypothetical protein